VQRLDQAVHPYEHHGTTVLLTVGVLYGLKSESPALVAMLHGAGAAAVGLLVAVTFQVGRKEIVDVMLMLVTLLAVSVLHVALPIVLAIVGGALMWIYRPRGSARARCSACWACSSCSRCWRWAESWPCYPT
jgi:chromate transporter